MGKGVGILLLTFGLFVWVVGDSRGSTVVVDPNNMNGWVFATTRTAISQLVYGPGGAGCGELCIGSDSAAQAEIYTNNYLNTRLDSIVSLSYSTYMSDGGTAGNRAPTITFFVDSDGNGVLDDLLLFEPYLQQSYNGGLALVQNTWQTWDAMSGGWWDRNSLMTEASPGSLQTYLQAFPNAKISMNTRNGIGGVLLLSGIGSWAGTAWTNARGYTDHFSIGLSGQEATLYDFEPVPEPTMLSMLVLGGFGLWGRRLERS